MQVFNLALRFYNLIKKDLITILTTSGNFYISSYVTNEIEKFFNWNRKISSKTKLIIVNYEFGYPYKNLIDLKKYNIAIIEDFAREHYSENDYFLKDGYLRVAYKMLDLNIVAVIPSAVYRILKRAGLLNNWKTNKRNLKASGFRQPDYTHKHWHLDIKYLNFNVTFLFLISAIDAYSRYLLHHQIRHTMNECDVQLTIQKARDKYTFARPRIITDNGSQFIAKEFKMFIKETEFIHVKTSISNPQANGKIERYHRTISEEFLRIKAPTDLDIFIIYIKEYINFYNTQKLHASLNYLTPEDYNVREDGRTNGTEN